MAVALLAWKAHQAGMSCQLIHDYRAELDRVRQNVRKPDVLCQRKFDVAPDARLNR